MDYFDELVERAREGGRRRVAVAAAHGRGVLLGMARARDEGLAEPVLVGDADELRREAREAGISLEGMELVHRPEPAEALAEAIRLVRAGEAQVLQKGHLPTPAFLSGVLRREGGLRGPGLLSHMAVFHRPDWPRPLFLTDSGMLPYPTLEQKVEILRNGIRFLRALGIERPRVAVLASSEEPDPRIPPSVEARALAERAAGDALGPAVVEGPLALDLAISPEACEAKGFRSEVAGRAELLICPDVVAGNLLGKSFLYAARARGAGVVLGGRSPIVMLSRADGPETRLASLALALVGGA